MQISLLKDAKSNNPQKTRVSVNVSADDHDQAKLLYSHSFDLQPIQEGRSITVEVFDSKPKPTDLRKYGKLLFGALFSENGLGLALQLLQGMLCARSKCRIMLDLNGDHDLDVIPWEYSWANNMPPTDNEELAINEYLANECIFTRVHRRKMPLLHQLQLLPLRVLIVVPDPIIPPNDPNAQKFPDLYLKDQFQNFLNGHHLNNKKLLLELVFPPTVERMYELIRSKPETATVLHFMGHCGTHDDGARALIFEDQDTGNLNYVHPLRLDTVPNNLRLAFLSACGTRHIARGLVENGVPYSIGSHCSLPDDLARKFEYIFYQTLAGGYTVETAMLEARASMIDPKDTRQLYYFPGAMVLYSSTFQQEDGRFKCDDGKPTVEDHMPHHNLPVISITPIFCGRRKQLNDVTRVLSRMSKRGRQTCHMYTIEGISGQGKTALAEKAVRRTAYLFPGGIFAWRFDPSHAVSVVKYLQRLCRVLFRQEFANEFHALESGIIKKFESHPTTLLILDQADVLKCAQVRGDEGALALVNWLQKVFSIPDLAVKILATSNRRLNWTAQEEVMHLDGLVDLDIDSGVEVLVRNLDVQVRHTMAKEENTTQLLRDLVRLVDGHPLCLKSLARAVGLPHPKKSLEDCLHQQWSTLLKNGSNDGTNLGSLFRPTIDTLKPLECQLLFICSLFTGPITQGVLEFVRHFVECVHTSKNGIDSSETIAMNLQQLHGRGLLSKMGEEYWIPFALREGARMCNSMMKFRLRLPIAGLLNDIFIIGVVGTSPHVKSIVLEWQLRRIHANSHREPKTRGFGIHYFSIGNEGLRIFEIDGRVGDSIDDNSLAKFAPQQDASYRPLTVFIYNTSESNHDSLPQFCKDQIIPLVQEKQMTFILCLNHTDDKFVERSRTALISMKKTAEILRNSLKTHWIIRTETPFGIAHPNANSASNKNMYLDNKTVKGACRKRNDNVRMEGSFIGRTKELENLIKLLDGPKRFITIKGFGGIGKTSLALQAFKNYNSGSALALSLAGSPRSSQVILKIAEFFAIDTKGLNDHDQQDYVLRELEWKEAILLYLDNVEDVKHAMNSCNSGTKKEARELLSFFKGLPDNVKILATSRILLDWPDEYSFDLAGLPPPEGMRVFRQWTPQRSKTEDIDDERGMELSRITDGHPLSLRLLGGMFDNSKEPVEQFVNKVHERLNIAMNKEFVYERHETIHACIEYSFDHLNDALQKFLGQLREWNVPFTSTLIIRALNHDPATSPVATNLHKLWQRSWLNRRIYEQDPMLGDWRPNIIENETEFYSLHPRLHDFLKNRFDNIEAILPNDAEIQFYTALCYGVGFGVANDLAKQIEWCTKASNNGHLEAQLALAASYQGGCGVNPDPKKAFDLCLKTAEAGSQQAQSEIVMCYRKGRGVKTDEEKATYWEQRLQDVKENKTAPILIKFDLSLPLIHRFAFSGDVARVKSLCTNISNVSVRDRIGRTPLHVAAQKGHIEVIESLVYDYNADISPKDLYDDTPLHLAAENGHTEVVWLFVTDFALDPSPKNFKGVTPLHCAAIQGHVDVARLLLADSKADANAKTEGGNTPLHFAAQYGDVEGVKVLLADSRVDANAKTNDGWTPLLSAGSKGHVEVIKVLLADSKADANAKNKDGWTSLHQSAINGHIDIVRLLLADPKVNANAKTNNGWTALLSAASKGHVEVVKLLLADSEADANAKNKDGWTPLHQSASNGHVDIVKLLLADSKVDANAKTNDGRTPLLMASSKGHVEVVKVLLTNSKTDANAKNKDGWTPLLKSACNGHVDIVRLLLANSKVDANAKTIMGSTPLDIAAKNGHVEVVKLLKVKFWTAY